VIIEKVENMFEQKTLLITGGTGSFGKTVLKRFLDTNVHEIRIFSRDEKKQEDMRLAFKNEKLKFFLGDVRDYESLNSALTGVDFVFHAAALKQVPSCEFYPMEAVRTNILGTENVIRASVANKIRRVVVLSTDKAVYPINAMGISKAMAEKIMIAQARHLPPDGTVVCATRYGNVMASRGSVIPLFVDQLMAGNFLTLTDPNMTRFLMSLDDSVGLVMHAFKHAKQGDIFVQKSPASTVEALAKAISDIFCKPFKSKIIGTRHGEKLFETLISREEMARAEDIGGYYRVPADGRDLNYAKYFVEGEKEIASFDDYTSHNTRQLDVGEVKDLLLTLDFIREKLNA